MATNKEKPLRTELDVVTDKLNESQERVKTLNAVNKRLKKTLTFWKSRFDVQKHIIPVSKGSYMIPPGINVDWQEYRRIVGKCETCGADMKTHTACSSCRILIGPGHLEATATLVNDKIMCGFCKGIPINVDLKDDEED